jgi:HEAT repeat protein
LRQLVGDADLIAIGQISSVRELELTSIEVHGQNVGARRLLAVLDVSRIVKGRSENPTVTLEFFIPQASLGYAGIAVSQFGMFFLRRDAGRGYAVLNPYYPFLVASKNVPVTEGNALNRVVGEIAQVLLTPGSSSDEQQRALEVLARVETGLAMTAIRVAAQNADMPIRLQAIALLLRRNDISMLNKIEDLLLHPPQSIGEGVLRKLTFAIGDGVKDPEAIPILTRLLVAGDVETRRAGAAALRHTGSNTAVDALSTALQDSDREVRYHAVLGLAIITGQDEWGPSLDLFDREEERYLKHWREWAKTR